MLFAAWPASCWFVQIQIPFTHSKQLQPLLIKNDLWLVYTPPSFRTQRPHLGTLESLRRARESRRDPRGMAFTSSECFAAGYVFLTKQTDLPKQGLPTRPTKSECLPPLHGIRQCQNTLGFEWFWMYSNGVCPKRYESGYIYIYTHTNMIKYVYKL